MLISTGNRGTVVSAFIYPSPDKIKTSHICSRLGGVRHPLPHSHRPLHLFPNRPRPQAMAQPKYVTRTLPQPISPLRCREKGPTLSKHHHPGHALPRAFCGRQDRRRICALGGPPECSRSSGLARCSPQSQVRKQWCRDRRWMTVSSGR